MARLASKLLILLAVLLMPFAMAPPAAAAQHHASAASMPMEHCPDEGSKQDSMAGLGGCTMACSAALPVVETPQDRSHLIVCTPQRPGIAGRLHGLHPETATPPPKRA
jgi:hypothetical protein